ncbi:MAG: adenylate/guanylate cyclase domain-containing protein [Alphaproteobacteria bacterium]
MTDDPSAAAETPGPSSDRLSWRPPLGLVLALVFGLLVGGATGLSLWITLDSAAESTRDLLADKAVLLLDSVSRQTNAYLAPAQDSATYIRDLIVSGAVDPVGDPARFQNVLAGSLAAAPQLLGAVWFPVEGEPIGVSRTRQNPLPIALPPDQIDRPSADLALAQVRARQQRDVFFGSVVYLPQVDDAGVNARAPVWRDGVFLGMVAVVVPTAALSRFMGEISGELGGRAFLLYNQERLLAYPDFSRARPERSLIRPVPYVADLNDQALANVARLPLGPARADGPPNVDSLLGLPENYHALFVPGEGGVNTILFVTRIGDLGGQSLHAGVYFPATVQTEEVRRLIESAIGGGIVALIAILLAVTMSRAVTRPVRRLAGASRSLSALDFTSVNPPGRSWFRETDEAAAAFRAMLRGLTMFETYVPRRLVMRLLARSGDAPAPSEEREVTVLFTDIVGFTKLAEQLSADQTAALLNDHFTTLATCIDSEGGTIDKYIGDSLMAFWGAPDDQPDHVVRALRAAKAIRDSVEADNRSRQQQGGTALRLRIGLHSGRAVVGNIGAPGRVNYTLVGDTVNIAQRLEALGRDHVQTSEAVVVLVSQAVVTAWRHSGQRGISFNALGAQSLRGRTGDVAAWRLAVDESSGDSLDAVSDPGEPADSAGNGPPNQTV